MVFAILGGALSGAGNARLDQLKADALRMREERMAQLQFERQRQLNQGKIDARPAAAVKDRVADQQSRSENFDLQYRQMDAQHRDANTVIDKSSRPSPADPGIVPPVGNGADAPPFGTRPGERPSSGVNTGQSTGKTATESYELGRAYPQAQRGGAFEAGKIYSTPLGNFRHLGPNQWAKL